MIPGAGRAVRGYLALKIGVPAAAVALLLTTIGLLLLGGSYDPTEQQNAGPCGAAPGLSLGTGAIAWPMPAGSYRLTSGFGPRWGTLHAGIDLAAPIGTPIYSAHDGVATEVGPAGGFGQWVVVTGTIDGQTVATVYGHVERFHVTAGQAVAAGDLIADVGNRGQSTGPHLHFEVHPGGWAGRASAVDPAGWLAQNVRDGQTTADPVAQPLDGGGEVTAADLAGPVAPQGRQATMALNDEQMANARTIAGVVKGTVPDDPATPVNEPLRVTVITLATAMQESTLRVIDYGDLAGPDSRGLFQQRTWWGSYEERMDPVISTQLFLLGGRGGQRGLLANDWQGQSLEDAVVDTQISVGGYAKWETQAQQLTAQLAGVEAITGPGGAFAACTPVLAAAP